MWKVCLLVSLWYVYERFQNLKKYPIVLCNISLIFDFLFGFGGALDAERVLRIDTETDTLHLVGPELLEGENKYQNGFAGKDGCM